MTPSCESKIRGVTIIAMKFLKTFLNPVAANQSDVENISRQSINLTADGEHVVATAGAGRVGLATASLRSLMPCDKKI